MQHLTLPMNRRSLLKISLASSAMGMMGARISASTLPKWDDETEILVVGGGFAGLSAGVTAARAGAKVLLIDKRGWLGGDGIISAAGLFYSSRTPLHDKAGITKNVEKDDYWKQICAGVDDEPLAKVRDNSRNSVVYHGVTKHNPDVLRRVADASPDVIEFLASFGVRFLPMHPAKPFQVPCEKGTILNFTKGMEAELNKTGKISKNLKAKELIVDATGSVVGLTAEYSKGRSKGHQVNIKARCVVLATGGFNDSDYLMKRYKCYWQKVPTGYVTVGTGLPGDLTGDGILMAKQIGAALEDMESMPKLKGAPAKNTKSVLWNIFDVDTAYLVGPDGLRRCDEHVSRYSGCSLALIRTNTKGGYVLFGKETFEGPNRKRWNFDNLLAEKGLFKADTIEELAKISGVDPKGLHQTIEQINRDAVNGKDSAFGRQDMLFKPINPPYYISTPSFPIRYKTEGGIEVNTDFQVLRNTDESPIKGLYAIGSTCGSITSRMADCVASGILVGPIVAKACKQ